ncbi:MAG: hypothetical protein MJ152_01770 [Clostridia bacterium]|nr:hypothetical protein [Clostridia bacterium]
MKIICVSGGSYKSFYLNCFVKLKKCNMLLFNFGLFYDYVVSDELLKTGLVTKELMMLARQLNTCVVAGTYKVANGTKKKVVIVCDGDKLEIVDAEHGATINLGGTQFCIGDETMRCCKFNKIILTAKRIKPKLNHCIKQKTYIFVDNYGTTLVKNKKLTRKSQKIGIFKI